MYAADALQEMLLSMRDGVIELFPAIPEKWKKERISFENLRGEKGLLISAEWIPDMGCEVSFMPKQDQTVYVGKREIDLYAGKITQIRLE